MNKLNQLFLLSLLLMGFLISCNKDEGSCTTCTKEANGTGENCEVNICDNSFTTNDADACVGVEGFINAASGKEARVAALRGVGYTCN